jgi:hypothetical protein
MRGVSHPTGEFHRGLVRGISVRALMYGQIMRAWYLAGGADRLIPGFLLELARSPKTASEKGYRRLMD